MFVRQTVRYSTDHEQYASTRGCQGVAKHDRNNFLNHFLPKLSTTVAATPAATKGCTPRIVSSLRGLTEARGGT